MSRILIVDDDRALGRSLQLQLERRGHETLVAHLAADGLSAVETFKPDVIFLDFHLPDEHGLLTLGRILSKDPEGAVVIITGDHDTRAAIEAVSHGASDYLRKPFDFDDVLLVLARHQRSRSSSAPPATPAAFDPATPVEMIGTDRKMVEIITQIGLLSRSRVPVLIQGETGTGKELAARMLHQATSPRAPFVAINCSAVIPTLMESEFFGHEKGAFTGADRRMQGKLDFAGEGTLFLDEIGDLPLNLQGKLLRVIQENEFTRIGGLEAIPFRARVLSATNRDLERLVRSDQFREDLFYRLAVSTLVLPPLRERRGDIPLFIDYTLARLRPKVNNRIVSVDEAAMARLTAYEWPGNVRELENVLARAVALARGPVLRAEDLEFSVGRATPPDAPDTGAQTLADVEKEHIRRVLTATSWNITRAARRLGISPTTLRKKVLDYHLRDSS